MLSRILSQCLLLLAPVLYTVQGKAISEHAGAECVCLCFTASVCMCVCVQMVGRLVVFSLCFLVQ